jgi:phenylacetate-coenzyme A ligase PaaK-like adenylate-forming protein
VIWPNPWGGAIIQLRADDRVPATIDCLRTTIASVPPDLVTTKPSLLPLLEELSRAAGARFSFPVLVSGAQFAAGAKAHARAVFAGPVVEAYGLTETGLIAADCPCGTGLLVDPDVIVQVLDQGSTPVPPDDIGQVVVTSLRNRVLPLVRYATGDLARIAGSAPCSRGQHLTELVGRSLRPFRAADGSLVAAARFHALFAAFPIVEFQLTEIRAGAWRLAVEPRTGTCIAPQDLRDWVSSRAGATVDVEVAFETINTNGGKFQRYLVGDGR